MTLPKEAREYRKTATIMAAQIPFDFTVDTPEGTMSAKAGSWLAMGVNGEMWAIQDDVFQKTYEPCSRDTRPLTRILPPEPIPGVDYGLYEISYGPDDELLAEDPPHGPILFSIHSLDDENRAALLARAHRHYTTQELELLLPRAK